MQNNIPWNVRGFSSLTSCVFRLFPAIVLGLGIAGMSLTASAQTQTVPDLSGQTFGGALEALRVANLEVGGSFVESSDDVPENRIIRTEPPAGTLVAAGSRVDLIFSSGPAPVTAEVPDLVGEGEGPAVTLLEDAGFIQGAIDRVHDETVPEGIVISQDPAAGTIASEGSAVDLVVSLGPTPTTVPAVAGLTESEALSLIEGAGLVPVVVEEQIVEVSPPSPTVFVLEQDPPGAASVFFGSTVALVVSRPAVRVPDFLGVVYQAAVEYSGGEGLLLLFEGVDAPGADQDAVIEQDPPGGELLPLDQPFRITANTGVEFMELTLSPSAEAFACLTGDGSVIQFAAGSTGVGRNPPFGYTCESYLFFDIESAGILQGATIESVQLHMRQIDCDPAGSDPMVLRVSPAATPWSGGTIEWGDRPAGTAPFLDYTEPCATGNTVYSDADAVLLNYVRGIADGDTPDNGLVLSAPDADSIRAYATQSNSNEEFRPRLTIEFESREPVDGDLLWLRTAGAAGADQATAIGVGPDGAVYAAGSFELAPNFAPPPSLYPLGRRIPGSSPAAFIAKWDAEGRLEWARKIGGVDRVAATSLLVDAAGDLLLAGHFEGFADIDPGLRFRIAGADSKPTGFVIKLNDDGELVWAQTFTGDEDLTVRAIALAPNGRVFAAGSVEGTAEFGTDLSGTEINITTSPAVSEAFVAALNSDGALLWAKTTTGTDSAQAHGLGTDAAGNVYAAGEFRGAVDFDPGPDQFARISAGVTDLFIQKLSPSGEFQWARTFGGSERDTANAITVDSAGNAYVTGLIFGSVDFGPGIGTIPSNAEQSLSKGFVLRLDAAGNLAWVQAFAAPDPLRDSAGRAIALSNGGILHVAAGLFYATFPQDALPIQGFLARLTTEGALLSTRILQGTGDITIQALDLDAQSNLHIAGRFRRTIEIEPGVTAFQSTSAGGLDLFVAKLQGTGEGTPSLLGDINGDGVVNAVDVQLVINAALGIDIGGFDADVNSDGVVNAVDVQLVINAALGIEINP